MNIDKLTLLELIAIKMASSGHISDTVTEWPILENAFKVLELPVPCTATQAKNLAVLIMGSYSLSIERIIRESIIEKS